MEGGDVALLFGNLLASLLQAFWHGDECCVVLYCVGIGI